MIRVFFIFLIVFQVDSITAQLEVNNSDYHTFLKEDESNFDSLCNLGIDISVSPLWHIDEGSWIEPHCFTHNPYQESYRPLEKIIASLKEPVKRIEPPIKTNINDLGTSLVKVFPVPSRDWVNIQFKEFDGKTFQVEVFDSNGKKVHHHNGNQSFLQMNLSYLDKGVYTVEILIKDDVFVQKIVLN